MPSETRGRAALAMRWLFFQLSQKHAFPSFLFFFSFFLNFFLLLLFSFFAKFLDGEDREAFIFRAFLSLRGEMLHSSRDF